MVWNYSGRNEPIRVVGRAFQAVYCPFGRKKSRGELTAADGAFLCSIGANGKPGTVDNRGRAGASGIFAVCAAANRAAKPSGSHLGSGNRAERAVRFFEWNRRSGQRGVWPCGGKQPAGGILAGRGFVFDSVAFVPADSFRKKSIKNRRGTALVPLLFFCKVLL